ncbi:acyl-CoA carboxylase epsilon subunit [Cellulomonas hominis]
MTDAHGGGLAHVQVVRGTPDDVELAALVAGLVAASAGQDEAPAPAPTSAWTARGRLRGSEGWRPGPGAWRRGLQG